MAERMDPSVLLARTPHGIPLFLQQLVDILRHERTTPARSESESEAALDPAALELGRSAALHGAQLMRQGFTVEQLVHGYGDVCQSVTELAVEHGAAISTDEFRILNRCLDNAIADAVASFTVEREILINDRVDNLHSRLEIFVLEKARLIDTAIHAFSAIKTVGVGVNGATGELLDHSLAELRSLTERTLPEVRSNSTVDVQAADEKQATSALND